VVMIAFRSKSLKADICWESCLAPLPGSLQIIGTMEVVFDAVCGSWIGGHPLEFARLPGDDEASIHCCATTKGCTEHEHEQVPSTRAVWSLF
jgi:hypothetical protein